MTSVLGQVRGRRGTVGGAGTGRGRPWPPGAFDQNGASNTGMVDDQLTSLSRTFTEFVSAQVSGIIRYPPSIEVNGAFEPRREIVHRNIEFPESSECLNVLRLPRNCRS